MASLIYNICMYVEVVGEIVRTCGCLALGLYCPTHNERMKEQDDLDKEIRAAVKLGRKGKK